MPGQRISEPQNEPSKAPPGRVKIVEALKSLLSEKEFNAITWGEIARKAGVNEALIYKYFGDRRNLLFQVLREMLDIYLKQLDVNLQGIHGALDKLRTVIGSTMRFYSSDMVFAKILLLEVRNLPNYFETPTYETVRDYSKLVVDIIKEGIAQGEIRDDISPAHVRDSILGSIEHLCLPSVIFGKKMDPDEVAESLCTIIFDGIRRK